MHRRIIGLEDRAFTPEEVKRWFRLIYMHYFPVNLLGGANQRRLFRRIKLLFEQPRSAKLTIHFISKCIQVKSIPWMEASLDQNSKTESIAKLITIIMRYLLIELRNTFYLTENKNNNNLFWQKFEWKDSTTNHIKMYLKARAMVPDPNTTKNRPALIRFIPSGDKFRMVMPLSKQILNSRTPNGNSIDKTFRYKGIELTFGKVIVNLMKKLIDRLNNDLVVNTDTVKLLNNRIKAFLFQNHQREIHGIQCDIEKCYDSLPISTVFKLCKREIVRFAENNSHIQYDFEVKVRKEFYRTYPAKWSFNPSNGLENRRLPSISVQSIFSWLDQVQMLPIRHYQNVFNYKFMPHSLLISKVAVCLYLQYKSVVMTASDEFKSAPFIACRMVDDIIILSADAKLCYTFYKSMADLISLNDRKTNCSLHIDPLLNKKEAINFHIAGISLSLDLKTVWLSPRINKNPIIFKDPLNNIPETIQKTLSGLLRFFCAGNIAPVSIVKNPWLFRDDFLSYVESVFTTLISRFYCIRSHLNDRQRKAVKPAFLVELMRMATKRIQDSFHRSLKKSPIQKELKAILRGLTWNLTAMARTNAIWKTWKKYKKFPEMQELRTKMVSKRPPMPKFDDKWNMETWAWVTRRFQPVANKNEIVKNLSKEF